MIASFLAAATAFVNVDELPGIDGHALTTMFRRELHLPDDAAWDAAFVQHVGYCSHYDHQLGVSTWPLPSAANADDLMTAAWERDLVRSEPEVGDIFGIWSPARDQFVRTGIIAAVVARRVEPDGRSHYECITLEGDLNERADGRGSLVRCVRRHLSAESGDCFVRWSDAGERREALQMAA